MHARKILTLIYSLESIASDLTKEYEKATKKDMAGFVLGSTQISTLNEVMMLSDDLLDEAELAPVVAEYHELAEEHDRLSLFDLAEKNAIRLNRPGEAQLWWEEWMQDARAFGKVCILAFEQSRRPENV